MNIDTVLTEIIEYVATKGLIPALITTNDGSTEVIKRAAPLVAYDLNNWQNYITSLTDDTFILPVETTSSKHHYLITANLDGTLTSLYTFVPGIAPNIVYVFTDEDDYNIRHEAGAVLLDNHTGAKTVISEPKYHLVLKLISNLIKLHDDKNIQIASEQKYILRTTSWSSIGVVRHIEFMVVKDKLQITLQRQFEDRVSVTIDMQSKQSADYYHEYINGKLFSENAQRQDDALELLFMFLKERGLLTYLTDYNIVSYAVAYEKQLDMLVKIKNDEDIPTCENMDAVHRSLNQLPEHLNTLFIRRLAVNTNHDAVIMSIVSAQICTYQSSAIEFHIELHDADISTNILLQTHKSNVMLDISLPDGMHTSFKQIYDEIHPYIVSGQVAHSPSNLTTFMDVFKTPIYNCPETITLAEWVALIDVTPTGLVDKKWSLGSNELPVLNLELNEEQS